MTEYDYSPEAYERHMATQSRISNWANNVSQSMQAQAHAQSPSQFSHPPSDYPRSRPTYHHRYSQSQTNSRSNSISRSHSRDQHHIQRELSRQRSHSYSNSRPQASRAYTFAQPLHSRTYTYALNQAPPPAPIPLPQPISYSQLAPRRSRTLPPQPHNVVYHTYDAPHGPAYVMIPPGGGPPQVRMHPTVTPTKRAQPLLKRLFTSFGPWGSASSGPSSAKSKHSHQTLRRHRRSSF